MPELGAHELRDVAVHDHPRVALFLTTAAAAAAEILGHFVGFMGLVGLFSLVLREVDFCLLTGEGRADPPNPPNPPGLLRSSTHHVETFC